MLVVTRFENLTDDTLALLGKAKLPVEILHDNNQQVPVGTVKAMLECGSKFTFTEAPSAPSAFEYGIMIGSLSARGSTEGDFKAGVKSRVLRKEKGPSGI